MRLAIVSQSARIYTQMAQQAGFSILAVDAFADVDTQQAAQVTYQWPGICSQLSGPDMMPLFEQLDAFEPEAILVGSGFEANQASYEALFARYVLLGNTPETVKRVKNPSWLKACCDRSGVQSPAITTQKPLAGQWLYKQAGQCGGMHVQDWQSATDVAAQGYWQVFQPGQAVGILFVADGQAYTLVGVHALRQHAGSYAYAGATRLHDAALNDAAHRLLQELLPALGLTGINSIDAIWQHNTLHLIEVNPRLSASMRLYADLPLIEAHIASCRNDAMSLLQNREVHASHCIAYTRQKIDLSQLDFPDWLEDRPSGDSIAAGQPICSLYAEGRSSSEVRQALQDKKTQLGKLWGTYVCNCIEFNIH